MTSWLPFASPVALVKICQPARGKTPLKKPSGPIGKRFVITVDFNRLDIKPGFKILDLGCGSGRHAGEALRFKDVFVIGADIDINNMTAAVEKLKFHDELMPRSTGTWGVVAADITSIPFKDDFFDIVICSEVMEHILDHEKAALEATRVLKHGGSMVVSVPRTYPERVCWRFSKEYRTTPGGHIRIYEKDELTALFEKAGLKVRFHHFAHSLHAPYWWLKCLVGLEKNDLFLVRAYHRILVFDMMKKTLLTRFLENLLNPVLGKSVVYYFIKTKSL